jgi:MHS family proline/betaine transporter-like MFS transporter
MSARDVGCRRGAAKCLAEFTSIGAIDDETGSRRARDVVEQDMNVGRRVSAFRATAAVAIGNVLEWYDFVVYGYFAAYLAQHFFPAGDQTASLLAAFAAFGVGFIFRPLGAFVIGAIGDRKGRKTALVLTIMLMAAATVLIGLLPSYATIGIAAPIALVAARLVQGFSIGGEWGTSVVYLVESAPPGKRGLYGSLQQVTVVAGLLLGSGIAASLATLLDSATMQDWGWRIPFLLGGIIAPIGFYMRRRLEETPAYLRRAQADRGGDGRWPIVAVAQAFGLSLIWSVMAYIFLVYMPTFTEKHVGLSHAAALWANTLALCLLMIAIPVCGLLSDRVGRKPLLLASCIAFVALPLPLFAHALANPSLEAIVISQLIIGLMIALYLGPAPAAIAETFRTTTRTSYVSTTNGISVALFGGFAPFIATWLIDATGSAIAPTYYVAASAAVSAVAILSLRETAHSELR